jgi:hypothetical protein
MSKKTNKLDKLKVKIFKRIQKIPGNVILRREINELGNSNQISRCIGMLIKAKKLVKIGHGIYAKSYVSQYSSKPLIKGGADYAWLEALTKLGVKWELGSAAQAYNAGISTQVPVRMIVRLNSRYRGKLYYNGRNLIIEKGCNMWRQMLIENNLVKNLKKK